MGCQYTTLSLRASLSSSAHSAVERSRIRCDSQGQNLALARASFSTKVFKTLQIFPSLLDSGYFHVPQVMRVSSSRERGFLTDNLLGRIHFIIVIIRGTGLAHWELEFPFPGSLTSTLLGLPRTWLSVTPRPSEEETPWKFLRTLT